jgi:hypothetical protein
MEGLERILNPAKLLNPLSLRACGWHGDASAAAEQVEDVFARDAQEMQQATCDNASAPDASSAMDGNRLTLLEA